MQRLVMKNWPFLAILTLALVARIAFFIAVQPWDPSILEHKILVFDATGYHDFALRVLEGRPLGVNGDLRTPGYPLILAGVYSVFGVKPWIVLLLQIAASAITLALLYRLTCSWFNQKAALAASLLYALEPHAILYTSELLSDTFFATFVLGSLVVFLDAIKTHKRSFFLLAGLLLGVATLIRPVGQFLPVPFIILAFFILRRHWSTALRGVVALMIAFLLTITPWLYRNYHEYGTASLTSIGGMYLLEWVVPYVEVARTGKQISEVREEFAELARQRGLDRTNNSFEKSSIQTAVAVDYIKQHPIDFGVASIRGAFYALVNLDTQGYASLLGLKSTELPGWFAGDSLVSRVHAFFRAKAPGEIVMGIFISLFLLVTYFLSLVGAWFALRSRNYGPVLITGALAAYFLVFMGPIGLARYKMPFVPLYVAIAGYGFSRLVNMRKV